MKSLAASHENVEEAVREPEKKVEQRTVDLKRQAQVLDLAYDAVIVWGDGGKIAFWSKGAQVTYGWTKEEAMDKTLSNLLHTRFPVPFQDIMRQLKKEGRWEGELIHTHKDGREITVLSRWAVRRDESGDYKEIMEVNRNISNRKANELAMRRAAAYNRSLIEVSLDPVVTIGPDGKITDVNAATEEATGYTREVLIGTDFSKYFTDLKKARAVYKLVFKKGFVRDYELEIRHRDGHVTPVFYNASIYKDETDQVVGVFAAARDISERKRSEREINEKSKTLEELNTAFKVLIDHYKNDHRELEERIITNIKVRILPYLEKLKQTQLNISQSALLEIIERSLHEITSPFLKMISAEQFRLTPKELEVVSLIKEGKTTKEIAEIVHRGIRTVDSYRDNIRIKLGIAQKKVNLRTYLLSTHKTDILP